MASGPPAGKIIADPNVLRDVAAAIGTHDFASAARIADNALRAGMNHPTLYNARALLAQRQGRYQDALDDFQRSLALGPRNVTVLNAIGLCLVWLNRPGEAVAAFDAAIELAPGMAEYHYRKGWAYDSMSDQPNAQRAYEQAIAIRPNLAEALSALAVIAARNGEYDAAREYSNRALRVDAEEPTAIIALAMADIADSSYTMAEQRLQQALAGPRAVGHTRAVMLGYLGDALDGQDRVADAFAAYTNKNEEHRRLYEPVFATRPRSIELLNRLLSNIEETSIADWPSAHDDASPSTGIERAHVFLLGFLRSGTTLLEQVLATHPDVVGLEERETFATIAPDFLSSREGLQRLAELSGEALARVRSRYWESVRGYGVNVAEKVFIDKQPLNTFNLPLIAKLFPGARIIFAIRDPRDVVFSCFRRHFSINATTYELLRLDDAARYYSEVMRMSQLCRSRYSQAWHVHRYETMVLDFDASVQSVCKFIDVSWRDEMRNFSMAARQRSIRSPSAQQVRRRLYDDSVGQWRRYAAQLSPALPILESWVKKYGYELE